MSTISTHVLDTALGRPAAGVVVTLQIGVGTTGTDGRARALAPAEWALEVGSYRLSFDTALYYGEMGLESFYSEVVVAFEVRDAARAHHVPLLLSPYGYTTYRGG